MLVYMVLKLYYSIIVFRSIRTYGWNQGVNRGMGVVPSRYIQQLPTIYPQLDSECHQSKAIRFKF